MRIPIAQQGTTQLARPKMTTTSPKARQTQDISGHAKGLQSIGGTIAQEAGSLYQKMDNARRFSENAKADVYQTDFMANAMMVEDKRRNADGSPITDLKTDAFQEELKRGRENLPNIYTDKNDLFLAQMKWDKSSVIANNNVIKGRYKNIAVVGDVNTREAVSKHVKSYSMGNDDALKSIEATIKEAEKNNIYDAKQADDLLKSSTEQANWSRYEYDKITNFDVVQGNLDKNTYNLSLEKLAKARGNFRTEQKVIRGQKEEELDEMLETGTLTEEILTGYKDKTYINQKKLTEYRDNMFIADAEDDPATYSLLLEKAVGIAKHGSSAGTEDWIWRSETERGEAFEQASLFRVEVLKHKRLGLLSDKQRDALLKKTKNAFAGYSKFKDGILQLKNFSNSYANVEKSAIKTRMYKDFIKKVETDVPPLEALQQVIKEQLTLELNTIPSIKESKLPTDVTEENITFTMKQRKMTRKQVMALFTPKGKK